MSVETVGVAEQPASGQQREFPWEISGLDPEKVLSPVLETFHQRHPSMGPGGETIVRAFDLALRAHEGQQRSSGEAYIFHPLSVARVVAEYGLDEESIAAAILHDVVEDTPVTHEELVDQFGEAIAVIVDGLTKLDRVSFTSKEAQQAATMRKMFVAIAKDWRVLIIKLADRLHNMRTLSAHQSEEKAKRIAQETLDVYAPLAHRLGMQGIKWQLEDLSFAALHPNRYAEIAQMVADRTPAREDYVETLIKKVDAYLEDVGLVAEVQGRPKHLWSIYEKMVIKGKEFAEIHDLVGIRILVESVRDCYAALGTVHAHFRPVPGRFKDFVAMPKFNLYQSLHTTVVGPEAKPIEVQIRTEEMHQRAELGIAAHWSYKSRRRGEKATTAEETPWLQRIVDWQQDELEPAEFMDLLKSDLEQDEVFVFTPKGDVVTLPMDSTPIDFAYAVHTDVGHRCVGARVNGRLAPLDSRLHSGDAVEIFTSKIPNAGPSRDWLQVVASSKARNKIRQWFTRERREDAIESGKDDLTKALRRESLPIQKILNGEMLADIAQSMNYAELDHFYAAVGNGDVSAHSIVQRIARELAGAEHVEQAPSTYYSPRPPTSGQGSGVHVEGLDDLMVRLSRCCSPVPGDDIVGFVTRGRGVSVHRSDCSNAQSLVEHQADRLIDVEWDNDSQGTYLVTIEVCALDRPKLLLDVTRILVENHLTIHGSHTWMGADRVSYMRFDFELADVEHLGNVFAAIRRIEGVYDVYRIMPGHGGKPESHSSP